MIYLDNSATTKIDPRVLEAMLPYLQEEYGNPSAKYYTLAKNASIAVEVARQQIAKLINAESDEIIFTSGASESNNFFLKGIAESFSSKGNHIITTKIEHKSIIETCKFLSKKGFDITFLEVDEFGQPDLKHLKQSITKNTILVSVSWGNNEIGTLNNIDEIGFICREHGIMFHSDATQVLGKINIDIKKTPIDFLSFSAHKLYGPKGIGAGFLRKDNLGLKREITPLIHGGGQEFNFRSGTLCTHNIVGFGKAAEIAEQEIDSYIPKIMNLEKVLKRQLVSPIPQVRFNGHPNMKIPGLLSITIPNVNNEILIRRLCNEVALSTSSSCSINEPSYVLKAIGMNMNQIRSTIRITIGKDPFIPEEFINKLKSCLS